MVAFLIILICFISAVLAIQIVDESLIILKAKQFLYLSQPYSKKLLALSKFKTWWKLIPRLFYVLIIFITIFVLILKLHYLFAELLDCRYCTVFHVTWILLLIIGFPIVASIFLAPLGILAVYIIEAIRKQ